MRTCGIPYALGTVTPPCASATTLVQVRTSTSGSFGWKTGSICQVILCGLSLPMLVKSASIGGLKTAMEWSWTERNFICIGIMVKQRSGRNNFQAYRSGEEDRGEFDSLLSRGVHYFDVLDERLF